MEHVAFGMLGIPQLNHGSTCQILNYWPQVCGFYSPYSIANVFQMILGGVLYIALNSHVLKILAGKSNASTQPIQQPVAQISCCAFNVDGSIFVTGSCDKFARVKYYIQYVVPIYMVYFFCLMCS
jgi:hypothetical protein